MMSARKVICNILGITAIYTACFLYGKGVELSSRPPDPIRYYSVISEASRAYDVHPALIAAVIQAESNFDPKALSSAGAKGLMQINPITQRHLQLRDAYDPHQNIHAGSRYLRSMLNLFRGNLTLALAAYNAGPGAVGKHGGVPPYRQTREYVKKVLAYYHAFRRTMTASLVA